ncbi:MAG TPA: GyrI-like domain-containing protein [Zoogloea sp.]|uniref:GyrI-like domain-containing protein n=1 Tax=Zoogloea sp. TaxID=49181 RepID=UPI002CC329E8|nr:GyrI-like domain-containing protein [Zoogloea sp.]HMV17652.1 GyrI-like domain-containing protein [Rhodocyclaceae bacterium]HMW51620.1 GyrI-like domain-containing protein [Rhodocyclaceae bacterium]HMY49581.1 GyrI-like domain-containing protein [Rhodocyclaceae bacterium]HNA68196.1 GyrI-like domain-containing protein [Rhodocyclaceae bacterium]HND23960.1 GyrI-like domain-containing protein [Rhodocyclaceae bacterium]
MIDNPRLITADARLTAVVPLIVPRADIVQMMGPAIHEVIATLHAQGHAPAGPCFSLHHCRPTEVFDFEVGFPVNAPVTPAGRVVASTLPGVRVAQTVYRGPYEGLGAAWGAFMAWIAAQHLQTGPGLWECYAAGPEVSPNPADWITELNCPVSDRS